MLHVPGQTVELNFSVPEDCCCNCGSLRDVRLVNTELKHTRYMLLAGVEITLGLKLPYCRNCERTSKRLPSSLFRKGLVAFGLFWALMLIGLIAILTIPALEGVPFHWEAVAIGAILLTTAFYLARRPSGNQTSYYQPVSLAALDQKFSGQIEGVALRCSNTEFARRFSAANAGHIASGVLEIRGAE